MNCVSKPVWAVVGVLMLGVVSTATHVGCGDPCAGGGKGTIVVNITGLPSGVKGHVVLTHPASSATAEGSVNLPNSESGAWIVSAQYATQADPRVRTAYAPSLSTTNFCLGNGGTATVDVNYTAVPTSNKFWTANSSGGTGSLLAFASTLLRATGSAPATVSTDSPSGRELTFDREGNVWSVGGTTADATIVRIPASALASSGNKEADRQINISDLACFPRLVGLAFDANGNLWASSSCKNYVVKLTADQLASSGTVKPAVILDNIEGAAGLAFDASGNLWVANETGERILRFDAASLSTPTGATPALQLGIRASVNPLDNSLLSPGWLAFAADGSLWGNNFGGNILFRVATGDLTGTGNRNINPAVRIYLPVSAVIEGFAFDEEGGLWTSYHAGAFARLSPSQLTTSSTSGSPTTPETIVSSSDIGSTSNGAFYPAPAALPLFHRLP